MRFADPSDCTNPKGRGFIDETGNIGDDTPMMSMILFNDGNWRHFDQAEMRDVAVVASLGELD